MTKKYQAPTAELILFAAEDVLTASGDSPGSDKENFGDWKWAPFEN